MIRPRACAAIIQNGKILMVLHRSPTREYWTLPGGGIENNEIPEQTIVREVKEIEREREREREREKRGRGHACQLVER